MTQTIDALKGTDIIVEVNTRGLYQKKSLTTYPSPWVLVLLKTAGIPDYIKFRCASSGSTYSGIPGDRPPPE
jgi:hypothetical protein